VIQFVARACYGIVREEMDIIMSQDDVLQRKKRNRSKPVLNIRSFMYYFITNDHKIVAIRNFILSTL